MARKFRVGPKIGSGSFGEIYAGLNQITKIFPVSKKFFVRFNMFVLIFIL